LFNGLLFPSVGPFSSPSPAAHLGPGRLDVPLCWSMTKQVENLQDRDDNKPQGRKAPREKTKNIRFFKTLSCLASKPVTILLTRQMKQPLLNWRFALLLLSRWARQRSEPFHGHGLGNMTRMWGGGFDVWKGQKGTLHLGSENLCGGTTPSRATSHRKYSKVGLQHQECLF